jgi:hypothetical protein
LRNSSSLAGHHRCHAGIDCDGKQAPAGVDALVVFTGKLALFQGIPLAGLLQEQQVSNVSVFCQQILFESNDNARLAGCGPGQPA